MNSGNVGSPVTVRTNATDTSIVRQNQSISSNSVGIDSLHDVNKDGRVNATDTSIVRQNQLSSVIRFFTAPSNFQMANAGIAPSASDASVPSIDIASTSVGSLGQTMSLLLPSLTSTKEMAPALTLVLQNLLAIEKSTLVETSMYASVALVVAPRRDLEAQQARVTDSVFMKWGDLSIGCSVENFAI